MVIFWVGRTLQQWFLFDVKRRVHQILLAVFICGVGIHAAVLWS